MSSYADTTAKHPLNIKYSVMRTKFSIDGSENAKPDRLANIPKIPNVNIDKTIAFHLLDIIIDFIVKNKY